MNQKGFAPILIILGIFVVTVIGGGAYFFKNIKNDSVLPNQVKIPGILTSNNTASTSTALSSTSVLHSNSPTPLPKTTSVPKSTSKPKPTSTPTPVARNVSVSGFAYEDRNDDGIFNSDDPKLPNMSLKYYDTNNPSLVYDYFTGDGGNFSISYQVRGNLVVNPVTYNNFRPRNGGLTFTNNATNIVIPFRSASAPVVNQSGVLEGDIFQDINKNNTRDSGENGIYFMKLYLKDENGNYYNTVEDAQTTDPGGHFKYVNLPIGKRFTLVLSNPTGAYAINKTTYDYTLTNTTPTISNLAIPVFQN